MTGRRGRGRFGPVATVVATAFVLARSAFAATREPSPTPRHARHDNPRSPR